MKRSYIAEMLECIDNDTISFAGGLPNEKLFDLEGLGKAAQKVLKNHKALQYSTSQGLLGLREQIAQIYTNHMDFPTTADEIMITTGSQQAFDVILKMFAKDEMVVQNPSYIGAINAFKSIGLGIKPFDSINELQGLLNSSNDLYLMSDCHNPCTYSYDKKQRLEIVNILKEKRNLLIEDGAYTLLNYDGTIHRPISADYDNAFHLGSFSKILAPGLRVGWIRASKEHINKIMAAKESIDLHTSTLNQMIIEEYISSNDLFDYIKKVRADYQSKMEYMARCFKKHLKEFKFTKPEAGMFIYGSFKGFDSMSLAQKALQNGVAFVPAEALYSSEKKSSEARFNFTNASFEQIKQGIKIIQQILEDQNKEDIMKSCNECINYQSSQKDEIYKHEGSIWFSILKTIASKSKYKTCYL